MADITYTNKNTGDNFTAADANEIKTVVNSKPDIIASGSQALGTSEIADGACASVITVSATGVATTDVITIGYASNPVGVTGYDPTGDELSVLAYPTSNNVNFLVCNKTGTAITPGAMTINWRVAR